MRDLDFYGVLLKEEASYGAGGVLDPTQHGILTLERPNVPPQHVHGGERRGERGPRNAGLRRARKSGRFGEVTLIHEAAGAGATPTATVRPSFHTLLRLCGFDATLDSTPTAEKYSYALGAGASGVGEFYDGELKYVLNGILADLVIAAEGPEAPIWEAALMGIMPALPVDAAVPAISYPDVDAPKADPIVLTLGDFAQAVVRSFRFSLGRARTARVNQNHAGNAHAGFAGGRVNPRLEVVIESPSFTGSPFHAAAAMNAYELAERASALALALTVGTEQHKRWKLNAPAAQLAEDPEEDAEDNVALLRLAWELNPTTPGARDNVNLVAD